ncbi:MAG: NADP oxidoreductase [Elusimicrobia bacterium]|nr:NADP oxidoreductase [Elusimicrobiota bacterium]
MKKRVATVWLGGCSGCHMSLLDIDEGLLEIAPLMDLVKSPLVDGKEFPENVDVAVVEGCVSTDQDREQILKIRERSKVLVALGDCAVTGNVTALRNLLGPAAMLDQAYRKAPTNDGQGTVPSVEIPTLLPQASPLSRHVKVDVYVPGCPPPADLIFTALKALLEGRPLEIPAGALKNG